MDILINFMKEVFSQCICIVNNHDVYLKYVTILSVNLNSIKVENYRSQHKSSFNGQSWTSKE